MCTPEVRQKSTDFLTGFILVWTGQEGRILREARDLLRKGASLSRDEGQNHLSTKPPGDAKPRGSDAAVQPETNADGLDLTFLPEGSLT